ncbi:MAG: glycosyltransferase family 2 protein [Holophaga sp.]|jgi:GT2 family glycosyltransferase
MFMPSIPAGFDRCLHSPWLPAAPFAAWSLGAVLTRIRLRDLPDLPPTGAPDPLPPVTLCIPARNEERELGAALDSWLAQDHPDLRILVVDDGSTDRTPAILAERGRRHPGRLRAIRNDHLPPGWLGKNHALDLASRQPEAMAAMWLLFADADAQASPDLLRRAFAFLDEHPADLLTLLPALDTGSRVERLCLPLANLCFLWLVPLGRVPDPRSRISCGVGGFILVRREAYDAVDGHWGAPLAAVDDMLLAWRVKSAGFTTRVALGGPHLHLRMYHSVAEIVGGLRKFMLFLPWLLPLAPLLAAAVLAATLGCALVALGGHPWAGLLLWLLVPPLIAEVDQRFTGRAADPLWALWPLAGLPVAAAIALAAWDRLRGVNRWRGREVRLR